MSTGELQYNQFNLAGQGRKTLPGLGFEFMWRFPYWWRSNYLPELKLNELPCEIDQYLRLCMVLKFSKFRVFNG